jgi:nitrogen-specific signal transduction histidine kinase
VACTLHASIVMLDMADIPPAYGSIFHAQSPRRIALVVALVVGLLGLIGLVAAEGVAPRPSVAKGLLFIAASGLVLYALTGSLTRRLMHAHSLLSAVVESIGDGVLILGYDRRIAYANPAALRMLESSADRLIGIGADEFSRRYGVSYMNGALVRPDAFASQRAFSSQIPVRYRARLTPSPGHELVILSSASAVRAHPDEQATMVVSVLHDITDAESLERDRDQLFAATAHALKTPVTIIKANAQHLEARPEQRGEASVAMIRRQCDRIDRLVQNLLIVARARSRTLELHVRVLDLAPLIETALRALPDVPVRAELHGSVKVRGDEERLVLAVSNLIYEARRDGVRTAPSTLRLATNAWTAEVAVHAKVLAVGERTSSDTGAYDDAKPSRCATDAIVDAHGGSFGIEEHDDERIAWIRLPIVAEDDRDDR